MFLLVPKVPFLILFMGSRHQSPSSRVSLLCLNPTPSSPNGGGGLNRRTRCRSRSSTFLSDLNPLVHTFTSLSAPPRYGDGGEGVGGTIGGWVGETKHHLSVVGYQSKILGLDHDGTGPKFAKTPRNDRSLISGLRNVLMSGRTGPEP